jgi:hypothetical protein
MGKKEMWNWVAAKNTKRRKITKKEQASEITEAIANLRFEISKENLRTMQSRVTLHLPADFESLGLADG